MSAITNNEGWVTISTDSGSGNTQVQATINEVNTGRLQRTAVLKGRTEHGAVATGTLVQATKGEYVLFDPMIYNIANTAQSVTITGKSNSQRLTFELLGPSHATIEDIFLDLPQSYTVRKADSTTVTVIPGQDIPGDPGATAEYNFTIVLTVNRTPEETSTCYLKATSYSGNTHQATITIAGIDSTILFDGQTSKIYDVSSLTVGAQQPINIGVTPTGEGWTLEFDE